MSSSSEVTVPLEQLQDIGERYSPQVLREFFLTNGFSNRPPIERFLVDSSVLVQLDPQPVSLSTLRIIKRILLFTVPVYLVCALVGAIAFSGQSNTWEEISDPTRTYDVLSTVAIPDQLAIIFLIYAIVSTIAAEVVTLILLRKGIKNNVFSIIVGFLSGIIARVSVVLELLAIVIILKAAPKLLIIAAAPYLILTISLLVQIRVLVSLAVGDNFDIINSRNWLSFERASPVQIQSFTASNTPSETVIPESIIRAASCPTNHVSLLRVTHASIIFDYTALSTLLFRVYASVPLQTDLLLASNYKSLVLMLTYQLLLVPIKAFLLYDFGPSPIVIASVAAAVLNSMVTCVLNVVPNHKRSIHHYLNHNRDTEEDV